MAEVLEFKVEGGDMLEKVFEQLPQKFADRIIINTFKKSSKPLVSAIKKNTPKASGSTRAAIGVLVYRKRKGMPSVNVGFRARSDGEVESYMKAYWKSYGTGANRDSSHSFLRKRMRRSANWKGGIRGSRIVERAWESTQLGIESSIENTMKEITMKLLKKYAVK